MDYEFSEHDIHQYLSEVKSRVLELDSGQESEQFEHLRIITQSLIELTTLLSDKLLEIRSEFNDTTLQRDLEIEYLKRQLVEYQNLYREEVEKQSEIFDKLRKMEEQLERQIAENQIKGQRHNIKDIEMKNKSMCQSLQKIIQDLKEENESLKREYRLNNQELSKLKQTNQELTLSVNVANEFVTSQQKEMTALKLQKEELEKELAKIQDQIQPLINELQTNLFSPKKESPCFLQLSDFKPQNQLEDNDDDLPSGRPSQMMINNLKCELNNSFADIAIRLKSSVPRQSLVVSEQDPYFSRQGSPKISLSFASPSKVKSTRDLWKEQNPYHDFFLLVCQSAKLNNSRNYRIFGVDTKHLYSAFLEKKVPFNRWYSLVQQYLLSTSRSMTKASVTP